MKATEWAPYLLALGNNSSAILNGFGYPEGWLVLMGTQMAMVLYGIATNQLGFVLQLMLVIIALNNWLIRPQTGASLAAAPARLRHSRAAGVAR